MLSLVPCLLLLLSFFPPPSSSLRGLLKQRLPPPTPERSVDDLELVWFTQKLNHSDPSDSRTWNQRSWANMENYLEGGPAFIFIGGEAEAGPGWLRFGQWYKWAQQLGAAMFVLEHRFYGQSHPTADMSTPNMAHLSSRQGLQDLAAFIQAMNSKHNLRGAWITFGGSYPGSLSSWMRQKFPELISGSVSSSGPVRAKLDFLEYFQVVKDALDTTGPDCNPAFTEAITTVEDMLASEDDWDSLSSMFSTCSPIDGNNPMDVISFMELVLDNLAGVVQYNGLQNEDIFSICKIMTDEANGSPLERLAAVNELFLDHGCMDHTYTSFLESIRDTNWSGGGVGWRQWIWQTCTEFGWYQTTNQPSGVYGSTLTLDFFEQWCQDAFGPEFTHEHMQSLIEASNEEYGGLNPDVSNVVYVHGTIDPWHAMGILDDISDSATAILITGTSHCNDMYDDRPGQDLPELVEARKKVGQLVAQWVGQK